MPPALHSPRRGADSLPHTTGAAASARGGWRKCTYIIGDHKKRVLAQVKNGTFSSGDKDHSVRSKKGTVNTSTTGGAEEADFVDGGGSGSATGDTNKLTEPIAAPLPTYM